MIGSTLVCQFRCLLRNKSAIFRSKSILTLLLVIFINSSNASNSRFINLNQHQHYNLHLPQINQQYIFEGPSDQQAKIGDRAILKCKFKNLKGEPQWCIDDFCLGTSKNKEANGTENGQLFLKGRTRYRIVGDKTKGEFHLLIEPVQLQDNMFFYCMATAASETVKAIKSNKVFLTVLTHPRSLHLNTPVHVSLNKPSSIQCIARQSRPPVKILIAINGHMINDETKYKTDIYQTPIDKDFANREESLNQNPYVHISSISSIKPEDMRQSYYDTITNVTIDDITMRMQGQTVECFAYSFVNDESSYTLYGHHSKKIQQNFIGNLNKITSSLQQNNIMSTKSIVQVDYAPEVNLKIVSASNVLKEEDVVSLVCETKATPEIQSYKWYIGKNYLNGVSDSNLNLKLRKEMHLKTVTCEASNTVASVKASLQLNILFNPTFTKGSKSYMLIDKSACNKPLTLDCQVSSNPASNITWYRRRLSRSYIRRLNKHKENKLNSFPIQNTNTNYYSLFESKSYGLNVENFNDLNNMYENEMIGTGPTYTIASFNCANVLNNLKNKTKLGSELKSKSNEKLLKRFKRENEIQLNDYMNDSFLDIDEYDYENEESLNENEDSNSQSPDFMSQNNDFGVYMCEATNKLRQTENLYFNSLKNAVNRRFIKLNPNGAPILGILPAKSSNNLADEQMMSLATHPHFDQHFSIAELPVTIGTSISLACLIDPIPSFQKVEWVRENGKIIPDSKYLADTFETDNKENKYELNNKNENLFTTYEETSTDVTFTASKKNKNSRSLKNFKTKYESTDQENMPNLNNEWGSSHLEVIPTTNYLVSSSGIVPISESGGPVRSILSIKQIRKQDLGIYKCKSTNSYGSRVALVILREKTFIDLVYLNSYVSFAFMVGSLLLIFILFFTIFLCMISRKFRKSCCCFCCFSGYTGRDSKDKELIAKSLHCESHSDKTINEWLAASSKLSNDSTGGNNSLANNTSTSGHTMATTLNNRSTGMGGVETHLIINSTTNSSATSTASSSTKTSTNSPRNELLANCSLLLNDDTDDNNCDMEHLNSNTLGKYSMVKQRDELESRLLGPNSQFNKYLVSSPLISSRSKEICLQKNNESENQGENENLELRENDSDFKVTNNSRSNTLSKKSNSKLPPVMVMRSNNLTNGNFNAKISTSSLKNKTLVSTPSLSNEGDSAHLSSNTNTPIRYINPNSIANGMRPIQHQFSNFNLNKHFENAKNQVINEKDFYETNKTNEDMNKMFPDANFRLSDLFNELSSPNCNMNSTYSTPLNNYQQASSSSNSSQIYNKLNTSSISSPSPKQTMFQSYPSFLSSPKQVSSQNTSNNNNSNSSSSTPTPPPPPPPPSSSRQLLLQTAASQLNNSNASSLVNKFPNPFINSQQQQQSTSGAPNSNEITSKFYNNFYRNSINKANV